MINLQQAQTQLISALQQIYDSREAANIAELVIENITGLKRIDRFINKELQLNDEQETLLKNYQNNLLKHKPVQYVLHEAWFAGMKFYVDENVLIPRPETEELVEWIEKDVRRKMTDDRHQSSILDIGTGSGCIPIALKKKLHTIEISSMDISENALAIAKQNAVFNNTIINFFKADILDESKWNDFPKYDIIVSNPPYIKESEQTQMRKNVLHYEPYIALFVPDGDALLFYKKMAKFGLQHLNPSGELFFEINELFGNEVCALLDSLSYKSIQLNNDLQGKDRMINASLK